MGAQIAVSAQQKTITAAVSVIDLPNGQLTDGGPSGTPDVTSGDAGPPFGAVPGSALRPRLVNKRTVEPAISREAGKSVAGKLR